MRRAYGSGYPGIEGRGVVGRHLPFWFWPVVWSKNASIIQPYLDGTEVSRFHRCMSSLPSSCICTYPHSMATPPTPLVLAAHLWKLSSSPTRTS